MRTYREIKEERLAVFALLMRCRKPHRLKQEAIRLNALAEEESAAAFFRGAEVNKETKPE